MVFYNRRQSRDLCFRLALGFLIFVISTLVHSNVYARVEWESHTSLSGAYDVKFPKEFKLKSMPLRLDANQVLFDEEIVATEGEGDDNPQEKTKQKTYFVKVQQTMAQTLGIKFTKLILAKEVKKYKASAEASGGILQSEDPIQTGGYIGKELYFTFKGKTEKDTEGMRIKIMFTDVSKIEQVLSGPASSMYSFKSNDFFDSLKLYDGVKQLEGKVGDSWEEFESPRGIFTIVVPPKENSFVGGPPVFKTIGEDREAGRFFFVDPLLKQKLIYNIFSYKVDGPLKYDDVKNLLFANHVSKFSDRIQRDDLKLENKTIDGHGVMMTRIKMRPLEKIPYIDSVLLQATFNENTVVVQEFMASPYHIVSPIGKTILGLLKFHPEKEHAPNLTTNTTHGENAEEKHKDDTQSTDSQEEDAVSDDEPADEQKSSSEEEKQTNKEDPSAPVSVSAKISVPSQPSDTTVEDKPPLAKPLEAPAEAKQQDEKNTAAPSLETDKTVPEPKNIVKPETLSPSAGDEDNAPTSHVPSVPDGQDDSVMTKDPQTDPEASLSKAVEPQSSLP